MAFDTLTKVLSSAVADAGTFTVEYPAGRGAGSYTGGRFHEVISNATGRLTAEAGKVSFSFGASEITITNSTGQTIPTGAVLYIQLDRIGLDNDRDSIPLANMDKMAHLTTVVVSLGAPVASDADGIVAEQAATIADGLATGINGALAADGEVELDVPRAVVAAWTTAAVLTVTGFDEYGVAMSESSASGTSMTGKKAFKRVTGVTTSADITGLTVGTGKVLGLPVLLPGAGHVIGELENGTKATAGTTVKADLALATATTGDVRGTYAPNGAPNGSKSIQLILALDDVGSRSVPQA